MASVSSNLLQSARSVSLPHAGRRTGDNAWAMSTCQSRQKMQTKPKIRMPENVVRAVLEAYTVTGAIGLARREGNRRYYDLLERLLPAGLLGHEVPVREQLRHRLLSRYRAHGLLGAGGASGTFDRIAPPNSTPERPERPGRNELRQELIELGAIVPVEVEGVRGQRFVLPAELALLQAPPAGPSVAFIAPFDSLLWDNRLVASLFGFDYVWEGFFPPARRRWGWYVLPISFRTGSSAGSSRGSTGTTPACRCSTSGGRTASRRAAPTGSPTRCGTPSARTCASRARTVSTGLAHLGREKRLFPARP